MCLCPKNLFLFSCITYSILCLLMVFSFFFYHTLFIRIHTYRTSDRSQSVQCRMINLPKNRPKMRLARFFIVYWQIATTHDWIFSINLAPFYLLCSRFVYLLLYYYYYYFLFENDVTKNLFYQLVMVAISTVCLNICSPFFVFNKQNSQINAIYVINFTCITSTHVNIDEKNVLFCLLNEIGKILFHNFLFYFIQIETLAFSPEKIKKAIFLKIIITHQEASSDTLSALFFNIISTRCQHTTQIVIEKWLFARSTHKLQFFFVCDAKQCEHLKSNRNLTFLSHKITMYGFRMSETLFNLPRRRFVHSSNAAKWRLNQQYSF